MGSLWERYQLPLYLGAALLGAGLGFGFPGLAPWGKAFLWPALAVLLFFTFLQVPFRALRQAFRDRAFFLAGVVGNFLLVPLAVWGLLQLLPQELGIRLGVALVLLVPCTDWFLAFSYLGRGDMARALVLTPLNLLLQLILLPFYLFLFFRQALSAFNLDPSTLLGAALVVLLPLFLAFWVQARPWGKAVVVRTSSWPVPLLALVVFLVALGHAGLLSGLRGHLFLLLGVFVLYLVLALGLSLLYHPTLACARVGTPVNPLYRLCSSVLKEKHIAKKGITGPGLPPSRQGGKNLGLQPRDPELLFGAPLEPSLA